MGAVKGFSMTNNDAVTVAAQHLALAAMTFLDADRATRISAAVAETAQVPEPRAVQRVVQGFASGLNGEFYVYGPQGCGKSFHWKALAKALECDNVWDCDAPLPKGRVDEYSFGDAVPPNWLVLTNDPRVFQFRGAIHFFDLMRKVGLEHRGC